MRIVPPYDNTQATFDPDLPARIVRRLEADPSALRHPAGIRLPRPRWFLIATVSMFLAVTGALSALMSETAGSVTLWTLAILIGLIAWGLFFADFMDGVLDLVLHLLFLPFVLALPVLAVAGLEYLLLEAIGRDLVPGNPAAVLLWSFAWTALACFMLLRRPWDGPDLARRHESDYIIPEELRFGSSRRSLRALQRATSLAVHARHVLGDSTGLDHALPSLRAEEWRLARECAHLDRLRERLTDSGAGSDTERIREALEPRWRILEEATRRSTYEIDRLTAYGRRLQVALDAHDEWVRLRRIADQADDFADLAARTAGSDIEAREALADGLHGAEAARATREEMIREIARLTSELFDTDEEKRS
ncbi:hypothetical protein ACFW4K_00040 [Nocardiopsis alba]|uniref:hypothetical protein n=1 Tax=Nocardiopsis alba TaxID=53437 RepID=UPI003670D1BA